MGYAKKTVFMQGPPRKGDGRSESVAIPRQYRRRSGKLEYLHPTKGWRVVRGAQK